MKHLTLFWANGFRKLPTTIAEFGPGDSLAIGLSAVLSGVNDYIALDVVEYASVERNLAILDELIQLFSNRHPGSATGWPKYHQFLDKRLFPSHILSDDYLEECLRKQRVSAIRDAIAGSPSKISIRYIVPWEDLHLTPQGSIDLVISHSVLEHVNDLDGFYAACAHWLRKGGVMTHQIDFGSHNLTSEWNGYRAIPESIWRLVVGRRPYLINRVPYSKHSRLIAENGFRLVSEMKTFRQDGIGRSQLSARWRNLADEDLDCSEAFVQAVKL